MEGGGQEGDFRVLSDGQQDEMMMDVGLREKPRGDPPDSSKVWVEKVVGGSNGGRLLPGRALDDDFVRDRLQLEFPDGEEGEAVVTIGKEVLEAMNGLWKRCMIVKVLGRTVGIAVLQKKLRELWKPSGGMYVVDLPRQFFMVRFEKEEEYLGALTGGPWKAFGSYLMVQAWSAEFDPLKDDIVTTPVWIHLLNIPVNFYHPEIIMGIAKGLGDPLRVDLFTLRFERARYARVCIAVNLSKPLKGSVMVNGERYFAAYEGLTNICSKCGLYGHLVHGCPRRMIEATAARAVVEESGVSSPNSKGNENSVSQADARPVNQDEEGFTLVRKNGRHGKKPVSVSQKAETRTQAQNVGRNLRDITGGKVLEKMVMENRFGSLEEDMEDLDIRKDSVVMEGDKENNSLGNIPTVPKSAQQATKIVFGANAVIAKNGSRARKNDTRGGPRRPMESKVYKPKLTKVNRPGRGLVFGPNSGEEELNSSGKRLRVEKANLGRKGGAFTREGTEDADEIRGDGAQIKEKELQMVLMEETHTLMTEEKQSGLASSSPESTNA